MEALHHLEGKVEPVHRGGLGQFGAKKVARYVIALADCLEDVDHPTRIVVERVDDDLWDERPWFGRICRVLQRVGLESDALEVVFRR
jgi:hypothetical protein